MNGERRSAVEQFLMHACRVGDKVDLRTKSGYLFSAVSITQVQDGAAEVKSVESRVARLYVLVVDQIEWAVRSRSQQ